MEYAWVLVQQECTGCGICADVCDFSAIRMGREMAYPKEVAGACTGCMECVQQCPFDALDVKTAC